MRFPVPEGPARLGVHAGLAFSLWLPKAEARGGVLVLAGAGSVKESHYDWARACRTAGWGALCVDLPGHGETGGELGAGVLGQLGAMLELLPPGPLIVRGSSMGGYLALVAAGPLAASAVIAICPASAEGLARGLRGNQLGFAADMPSLEAFLLEHDDVAAARQLEAPVLLLHAEGDERVPVAHSRELRDELRHPASRLIAVPGGHHRSVQHDGELQATALRWMRQVLEAKA